MTSTKILCSKIYIFFIFIFSTAFHDSKKVKLSVKILENKMLTVDNSKDIDTVIRQLIKSAYQKLDFLFLNQNMSFTLNHSAKDDEFLGSTHILLSARNCIAYVQRGSLILLSVDWHQKARVECFEPVQKDVNSDRPTSAMQRSYSGICTLKIMAQ